MDAQPPQKPGRRQTSMRFTDNQIIGILRTHEQGTPAADLCRLHRVSSSTFYKWKARLSPAASSLLNLNLPPVRDGGPLGRPSRIALGDIVRAVQQVGAERANIKNVAKHLGMSPTGLYHHVKTREELLELVAQFAFGEIVDHPCELDGFDDQLYYYAERFYRFYAGSLWAMQTILSGYGVFTPKLLPLYERLFASGVQEGFTVLEVYDIWTTIMAAVVGAAVIELAQRVAEGEKTTLLSKMQRALLTENINLPNLRALVDVGISNKVDHFEKVRIMIAGLRSKSKNRLAPDTP